MKIGLLFPKDVSIHLKITVVFNLTSVTLDLTTGTTVCSTTDMADCSRSFLADVFNSKTRLSNTLEM